MVIFCMNKFADDVQVFHFTFPPLYPTIDEEE